MHPILFLILVIAVLLTVSWLKQLSPSARKNATFKIALGGAALLLLFAVVTGRLNPLIALVVAAIPIVQRVLAAKSIFDRIKSMSGPRKGQSSNLSTRFLEMTLDHDSGEMTGRVLEGRFEGRRLDELGLSELLQLLQECRAADAQSAAVLEAYLDRHHGADWRDRAREPGSDGIQMTAREARQILGVDESAGAEEIVAAHRRLMQRMHPDRGGSDYLAAKINQAKDVLLDEA